MTLVTSDSRFAEEARKLPIGWYGSTGYTSEIQYLYHDGRYYRDCTVEAQSLLNSGPNGAIIKKALEKLNSEEREALLKILLA